MYIHTDSFAEEADLTTDEVAKKTIREHIEAWLSIAIGALPFFKKISKRHPNTVASSDQIAREVYDSIERLCNEIHAVNGRVKIDVIDSYQADDPFVIAYIDKRADDLNTTCKIEVEYASRPYWSVSIHEMNDDSQHSIGWYIHDDV